MGGLEAHKTLSHSDIAREKEKMVSVLTKAGVDVSCSGLPVSHDIECVLLSCVSPPIHIPGSFMVTCYKLR